MTESVKSCVSTYLGLYVFCGQIQGRSSSDAIDYRIDDDLFDVVIFKFLVLQHYSIQHHDYDDTKDYYYHFHSLAIICTIEISLASLRYHHLFIILLPFP